MGKSGSKCAPTTDTMPCGAPAPGAGAGPPASRTPRSRRPRRSPPVAAATASGASDGSTTSAPSDSASARRAGIPSTAITRLAVPTAQISAIRPTGSAAEHDDGVAGANPGALNREKSGRQDVGDEDCVLVGDVVGDRPQAAVGAGDRGRARPARRRAAGRRRSSRTAPGSRTASGARRGNARSCRRRSCSC